LDGLRPEIPAPEFRPSLVSGTLDEDGLARLEPLPSTAQVLEMTCGPFSAKVEIPDSRAATTVRALFHRSNPPRTEDGDRTLREFESDPRR